MENETAVSRVLDLSGQKILVTGASGNIGAAIAARLDEAGADVVIHYHRNEAAARALQARCPRAELKQADLRDGDAVDALIAVTQPTMVVNNAAAQPVTPLSDMTVDDWRSVLAANLDSAFLVTQSAARVWRTTGHEGAVVNVASIEALDPAVGHAHYATSKSGLVMLTRAAALEYGADGIRVNSVSPGLIDREGLETEWPEGVRRWQERAPLGRLGTAQDVANAVLFLLSPAARWISGANLVVDGGMSAQSKW